MKMAAEFSSSPSGASEIPANPMRFQKLKRVGLALCLVGLVASNIATVTSSALNALIGDFLSAIGIATAYHLISTDNAKLKKTITVQRAAIAKRDAAIGKYKVAVRKYQTAVIAQKAAFADFKSRIALKRAPAKKAARSIANRTVRVAKVAVARIPAESIPYIGIGVLLAGTAYDLKSMCTNMQDLNVVYESCGLEDRVEEGWMNYICHPPIPGL